MKKLLVVIILLLVAVLLCMTRPDEDKHKAAMMKAVKEYVDEEATNRGFGDNALTQIGKTVVTKAIETALSSKLQLNDYYLFNTTSVVIDHQEKMLSLGLLGHVFTFDKDRLRQELQEATRTKEVESVQKAAAKEEAKALKAQLKEEARKAREQAREQRRAEKEARKAQRRAEKEARKAQRQREKQQREQEG